VGEVLAHPSHSPDLAPSNCHLFSKLKKSLAGKTFSDNDEVQDTVMMWLREQAGDFYDAGIKKLVSSLTKCIAIHGDCVEK
jgi:histone-lysine N-methyltransferase SETMAR